MGIVATRVDGDPVVVVPRFLPVVAVLSDVDGPSGSSSSSAGRSPSSGSASSSVAASRSSSTTGGFLSSAAPGFIAAERGPTDDGVFLVPAADVTTRDLMVAVFSAKPIFTVERVNSANTSR